jgi:hypothetical protein
MTLTITSASFADGSSIPSAYTCEGDDVSPPLRWAGVPDDARSLLPIGTKEGLDDSRRAGYGGPCPAIGRHRYFRKLYALDAELAGLRRPTKAEVEAAMDGRRD